MIFVAVAVSLVAGWLAGFLSLQILIKRSIRSARKEAERILNDAQAKGREILLSAKEEALKLKAQAEASIREKQGYLRGLERRLSQREEELGKRQGILDKKEEELSLKERDVVKRMKEVEGLVEKKLQEIAGISREEAERRLLEIIEQEIRGEICARVRRWEAEARAEAEMRVRRSLAEIIQRYAGEVVSEVTTTTVPLPSDEIKGRLIGREGRNIRVLEQATGVELIVDDTPEVVVLSSFDPVRREIARIALRRLIQDGRIQPSRIEDEVERAKAEVEEESKRRGEESALKAGVGDLHPELIKLLGRLHFRTSYGQNVLAHSIEVSQIAGMLAAEIGANVQVAKKAGLLHDLGKGVEGEGPHALLGAQMVKQWDGSPEVVAAVAEHHCESEPTTIESYLVAAADAISGARPGARKEDIEGYLRRLRELEEIALSFQGVEKAFAIQAGREVRVMVKPDQIDDIGIIRLSRDIAQKIRENIKYPGEIKVTVIRESRAVDYAR